jgi:hypothetical protein
VEEYALASGVAAPAIARLRARLIEG